MKVAFKKLSSRGRSFKSFFESFQVDSADAEGCFVLLHRNGTTETIYRLRGFSFSFKQSWWFILEAVVSRLHRDFRRKYPTSTSKPLKDFFRFKYFSSFNFVFEFWRLREGRKIFKDFFAFNQEFSKNFHREISLSRVLWTLRCVSGDSTLHGRCSHRERCSIFKAQSIQISFPRLSLYLCCDNQKTRGMLWKLPPRCLSPQTSAKQRNRDVYFLPKSLLFRNKFKFSEVQWAENYRGVKRRFVIFLRLLSLTHKGLWKFRYFPTFFTIKFKFFTSNFFHSVSLSNF
jgi:hypothetical protein